MEITWQDLINDSAIKHEMKHIHDDGYWIRYFAGQALSGLISKGGYDLDGTLYNRVLNISINILQVLKDYELKIKETRNHDKS